MLEQLDAAAARRVAERAVKSVSITAEADKLNIWIAFMNLENEMDEESEVNSSEDEEMADNSDKEVQTSMLVKFFLQSIL